MSQSIFFSHVGAFSKIEAGLEGIKLEFILKLKIKRNVLLLVDTCPQATNRCALFRVEIVLQFYDLQSSTKHEDNVFYSGLKSAMVRAGI